MNKFDAALIFDVIDIFIRYSKIYIHTYIATLILFAWKIIRQKEFKPSHLKRTEPLSIKFQFQSSSDVNILLTSASAFWKLKRAEAHVKVNRDHLRHFDFRSGVAISRGTTQLPLLKSRVSTAHTYAHAPALWASRSKERASHLIFGGVVKWWPVRARLSLNH